MSNFIERIKEKQRQKEIMIKASEAELRAQGQAEGERRIASDANLRYIYREGTQSAPHGFLPQSIINIIENAKAKRKRIRGKGKNDIEALIIHG